MKAKGETGIVFDRDLSKPDAKLKKRMKKAKTDNNALDLNPLTQPQVNAPKSKVVDPITEVIEQSKAEPPKSPVLHTPVRKSIDKVNPIVPVKKEEDSSYIQPLKKSIDIDQASIRKSSAEANDSDYYNSVNPTKDKDNNEKQTKGKVNFTCIDDSATNKKLNSNSNLISNGPNDNVRYIILKCHKECNEMSKLIEELSSKQDSNNAQNNNSSLNSVPKIEKDDYRIQLNTLRSELDKKEKVIQSLTQTNSRQRMALEGLSKQLDEKLGKVNFVRNQPQFGTPNPSLKTTRNKDKDLSKEENPFEKELRLKEKELKNAIALIDILSKDNSQLKTSLDTYGDYKKKLQLLDLSKSKDTEIQALESQIAMLKHELESHKQCRVTKQNQDAEIEIHKKDIKHYKKEIAELKRKLTEMTAAETQSPNERNLPSINTKGKLNLSKPKSKQKQQSFSNGKQDSKPKSTKEKIDFKKDISYVKLFTDDERSALMRFFDGNEKYELFIKKIVILEKYKVSIEAKHKNVVERLMDQIASLDEQIEYLNQKNKESESRLKIFQFQVNEYKQGKRVYQKKLNEYQSNTYQLENEVKEKKQEINLLSHKLDSIRSKTVGNYEGTDLNNDVKDDADLPEGGDEEEADDGNDA